MLTPDLLQRIRPGLDLSTATLAASRLEIAAVRVQINTRQRQAHWLGQLAHESGFRPVVENLNYSAKRRPPEMPRTRRH